MKTAEDLRRFGAALRDASTRERSEDRARHLARAAIALETAAKELARSDDQQPDVVEMLGNKLFLRYVDFRAKLGRKLSDVELERAARVFFVRATED